MPNFTPLGWQDVFELSSSLRNRVSLFPAGEPRALTLRGPRDNADDPDDDAAYVWKPLMGKGKWQEATNTIRRLKRLGDQMFGQIEFGRVFIELLDPGTTLPWTRRSGEYANRFARAYVALRTNPAVIHHCGTEGWFLQLGQIVTINHALPQSALNLGDHWCAHLVLDVRKKTEDTL